MAHRMYYIPNLSDKVT